MRKWESLEQSTHNYVSMSTYIQVIQDYLLEASLRLVGVTMPELPELLSFEPAEDFLGLQGTLWLMLPGVGRSSLTSAIETLGIPGFRHLRFKASV